MLNERSIAVQHQLAEQAAADADATGVKKIVGDFWATGMDEAKINAQGITPIQDRLDAIAKLDGSEAIAEYLRTSAARGENFLFGLEIGTAAGRDRVCQYVSISVVAVSLTKKK